MITEIACAKINLYLHVGGVRGDGLHDLASLFVFADQGDEITVEPAQELSLTISGPFAESLQAFPVSHNLILKAATQLRDAQSIEVGARINLVKNLPVAAGIGGGSADAAAALRALTRLWNLTISSQELHNIAFALGADVPACLETHPIFVSGAGEVIERAPSLPQLWVCLANPRVETPTGPIFKAFDSQNQIPEMPKHMGEQAFSSPDDFISQLSLARNDLQAPAIAHEVVIKTVIEALTAQPGALLSRMSGSGATCFALFDNLEDAKNASVEIERRGWWAMTAKLKF